MTAARVTTVLVVDDEPLARRKLAALTLLVPWAQHVGEASDGAEALDAVDRLQPDVMFLDVQMPELSGLQVMERLRSRPCPPLVIFTTAYNEHAVAAFELQALDYLLKPFGESRFMTALERARHTIELRATAATLERAQSAFTTALTLTLSSRIFVRDANAVLPVCLTDIEHIQAEDDYVMICTRQRRFLASLRIRDLEQRLPNPPFLRVHRSHIVNLDHLDRMVGLDDSRFEARMKSGTVVPVSRARSHEIRKIAC